MVVEQQIMIIYALNSAYLDDVDVKQVRKWEADFHDFMAARFPEIGQRIHTDKKLSDELEVDLRAAIEEFKSLQ